MTSFARLGELAAVHRTYEQLRQALAELVGVAPSDATERHRVALLSATQSHLLQTAGPDDVSDPAPSIEYADNRGVRIAYQVVGGGPVDLAFIPSFVTNLATTWEDPTYAEFLGALATRSRLLLFDKRGTGLSDPALDFPSAAERSEDLAAVLDAAGSGECVLFGVCAGAALAIQFAVDHPERTAGLVLFGGFARMLSCPGYPWGWPEQRYKQFLESFEDAWLHSGERISRRNPALVDNPRYRRWFERYLQVAASPYLARRLAEMNADLDVRDLLPRVAAPALVMVHADDVWMAAENSSYLAQHLPHARLVTLPGRDHDPWTEDTGPVLAELESFLNELSQGRIALNT
jgi:pimeloyl-ACP methyl ester carboxylesterase